MSESSLKQKTAKGLLWGGIGSGSMQLLNLVFGIFLSRLLSPADYGVVGALTIFSATAGLFAESGFTLAIVNRKSVGHDDYNAVFWFNIVAGLALYGLLFALAPLIAHFYRQPEMVWLARFLFLGFLFGAISTAPSAYFFRNLNVKLRSQNQICAILVSGTVGVSCAVLGCGYWGIAAQTVSYSGCNALLLWLRSPWHPTLSFRMAPLREMLPFSIKQLMTSLFTHINNNFFSVLLGRLYGMSTTGYYTQGSKWTTMGYSTISGMLNSVAQPVFREASDERERICRVFVKMLRFTSFVCFPAMFGLAIVSKELIVLSVTVKWLPCVPVMQILCVWGAFMPIATLYGNLFNSIGRPNIYMWNTIALGLMQLVCVIMSSPYGLEVMLEVYTVINVGWLLVWHHFARRHIGLSLWAVLKGIMPYLAVSLIVMAVTVAATAKIENLVLSLVTKIALAVSLYGLLMWRLKSVVFRESIGYLTKGKIRI